MNGDVHELSNSHYFSFSPVLSISVPWMTAMYAIKRDPVAENRCTRFVRKTTRATR